MASPVQSASLFGLRWRRQPSGMLKQAPRALAWTLALAITWALVRPPITLLAGMVREQPPGSEHLYFVGMGIGIALDLAAYGFLSFFLVRRERWAQAGLIGLSLVQVLYWTSRLVNSPGTPVAVPANFPEFTNPPLLARDAMYMLSIAFTLPTMLIAMAPSMWRWTSRNEQPATAPDAPA